MPCWCNSFFLYATHRLPILHGTRLMSMTIKSRWLSCARKENEKGKGTYLLCSLFDKLALKAVNLFINSYKHDDVVDLHMSGMQFRQSQRTRFSSVCVGSHRMWCTRERSRAEFRATARFSLFARHSRV